MPRDEQPSLPMPTTSGVRGLCPLPLAIGELDERDAAELQELKDLIRRRIGFHCGGYKEKCLRRRLGVRMRARGVHRYSDYGSLLDADPTEFRRLLEAVAINVSKFFRNPEVWEAVRETVLPSLFALKTRQVRIWSAGCAGGEEPYTIAIMLREYAEANGLLDQLARFRILASDVDEDALTSARRAEYMPYAMTDTPADKLARWFEGASYKPRAEIRDLVEFTEGDLMMPGAPARVNWVVCRNVVIYFEREIQEDLFSRFGEALLPDGFLLLGKVETLVGPAMSAFRTLRHRERIFQKV